MGHVPMYPVAVQPWEVEAAPVVTNRPVAAAVEIGVGKTMGGVLEVGAFHALHSAVPPEPEVMVSRLPVAPEL
jgi:hypothetical protein